MWSTCVAPERLAQRLFPRFLREPECPFDQTDELAAAHRISSWSADVRKSQIGRRVLRQAKSFPPCPFPVYPCLGNHDKRANFAAHFPHIPMPNGFAQYAVALDGLRLVVIDTLEVGRHGGGFCHIRAAWLRATLEEDRETPTLIVMHHPPLESGIDWMSTHPDEPWVQRFSDAIAGHGQIHSVVCGHIHRAIAAPWKGVTVTVCPATAPQLTLDLNRIDPETPDGRSMVIADPPGYALHRWSRNGLVSLFETAQEHPVLAKFDHRMQALVRELLHERPV